MKLRGIAPCALAAALAVSACGDRNEMSSATNERSAPNQNTSSDRRTLTVTGCFQEASGFNNYVLTNTTGSQGSPEERGRGYRIERGGELEQHVGKQVRVSGWVDADDDRALMQGDRNAGRRATSGQTGASEQGRESTSERTDFNDLPELHVDHIERVGDNCSSR